MRLQEDSQPENCTSARERHLDVASPAQGEADVQLEQRQEGREQLQDPRELSKDEGPCSGRTSGARPLPFHAGQPVQRLSATWTASP